MLKHTFFYCNFACFRCTSKRPQQLTYLRCRRVTRVSEWRFRLTVLILGRVLVSLTWVFWMSMFDGHWASNLFYVFREMRFWQAVWRNTRDSRGQSSRARICMYLNWFEKHCLNHQCYDKVMKKQCLECMQSTNFCTTWHDLWSQ